MKRLLILILLLPIFGMGQGTQTLRIRTLKTDTAYINKLQPISSSTLSLVWDSVTGKIGTRPYGGGSGTADSIWKVTLGTTIEKRDSSLQIDIVQQSGGDYSKIFGDNSMLQLSVLDGDFRTPADSLVNDSTSKGQIEVESKAPGAGFGAGYYLSAASGINLLYMASGGKQSVFGLDDAYKGTIVGSSEYNSGGRLNVGASNKPFGTGYFGMMNITAVTAGLSTALYVKNYIPNGNGITSYTTSGVAVYGASSSGNNAVQGSATSGTGLYGTATTGTGLFAKSTSGLQFKFGNDKNSTPDSTMIMNSGGQVGIGKTNPGTALDVNGVITATGGTSTDWNAKIGGSLTSGYIPYATAATTVGNSGMYWDNANGRVGIGTSAPGGAIDAVSSSFPVGSFIRTTSLTSASDWNGFDGIASGYSLRTKTSGNMGDGFGGGMVFSIQDATSAAAYTDGVTGRIYTRRDGSDTKGAMQFYTTGENASTATMTLRNSGNVGINTTSPISTLHVAGSARVTDSLKAQQTVWMPGLPDKAATGELYRNGTTGEISYHSRVSRHTPSGDSIPTSALAPVIFLDPAGNITFNDANYGGVMEGLHDGQIVRIINLSGTYTTTFKQSAYVLDEGGSDITLGENESITIVWGAEETKWIIIGISPSL